MKDNFENRHSLHEWQVIQTEAALAHQIQQIDTLCSRSEALLEARRLVSLHGVGIRIGQTLPAVGAG